MPPVCAAQLLKATLLQPVRDIPTINARLDALDELLRNEPLFMALTQLLKQMPKARACTARSLHADDAAHCC